MYKGLNIANGVVPGAADVGWGEEGEDIFG